MASAVNALELLGEPLARSVENSCRGRSTTSKTLFPAEVEHWPECDAEVHEVMEAQQFSGHTYLRPTQRNVELMSEGDVMAQLAMNVTARINDVLSNNRPGYVWHSQVDIERLPDALPRRTPDLVLLFKRNGKRYAATFVEAKKASVLRIDADIVQLYKQRDHVVIQVFSQLTTYFGYTGATFAGVCNFHNLWLVKAAQGSNKALKLKCSKPFTFDSSCTPFNYAAYALSVLAIDTVEGDNAGPFPRGPREVQYLRDPNNPNDLTDGRDDGSSDGGNGSDKAAGEGSGGSGRGRGSSRSQSSSGKQHSFAAFSVLPAEALQLGSILGRGAGGVVVEGVHSGVPAAIKLVVDELVDDPAAATADLWRETRNYELLSSIQGSTIPAYLGCGRVTDAIGPPACFAAFERVAGKPASMMQLTPGVGLAAQRALRRFHESGALHGDLRLENLLIAPGEAGGEATAMLIDLATCTINAHADEQKAEEAELVSLFAAQGLDLQPVTPPLKDNRSPRRP